MGLTGSIGMGKSTTADMFRKAGIPVWSADAAVHQLYGPDGAATQKIQQLCPESVTDCGIDREILSNWISGTPEGLARIEKIVHPLVYRSRQEFLKSTDADIAVLDIPLLFETGGETEVDMIVVVSAPADEQRRRVLARPGMTEEKLNMILSRQTPDAEKRSRADWVIETTSLEEAETSVQNVIREIRGRLTDAGNRT